MANVTLTQDFSRLNDWPGLIFQGDSSTRLTGTSGTGFTIKHGAGSPFDGFRIVVKGSGLTYQGGVPTGGTMDSVKVVDAQGDTVITFAKLAGPIADDASQFHANVFGSPFSNAGPGPDGKMAWNHLLSGDDVVTGTSGDDHRAFTGVDGGDDTYKMGAGDDQVTGGIGDDTYVGGSGYDMFTFRDTTFNEGGSAVRGATIDVDAGKIKDPWGGTDKISGFEEFQGSRFDDRFYGGDSRDDNFSGLRGRDHFDGGGVNDGGSNDDSRDRVYYRDDYWEGGQFGVVVDLETSVSNGQVRGTATDGFGNRDTLVDIEDVQGTRFGDSLTGSRYSNNFAGGEGRDTYDGGGSDDWIFFSDWFVQRPHGIDVDLSRSKGQIIDDGFGNTETARSIEGIIGTDANDRIKGNGLDNYFTGNAGSDTLTGGGGADDFHWHDEGHFNGVDRVTDFSGGDTLSFEVGNFGGMTDTLVLVNGAQATQAKGTFIFDASRHTLYWDEDGTGSAGKVAIAKLDGVTSLNAGDFELWS